MPPSPPRWIALLLLSTLATALALGDAATGRHTRALLVVRTLVIDALGTRTVDTDTARIPFGKTGLLTKKVSYGGPPLSFRLSVRADEAQDTGIPLVLSADVWQGEASPMPTPDRLYHREEATILSGNSSYLFELDHDEATQRRILLSITARGIGEEDELGPLPAALPVHFFIEITRRQEGADAEVDSHALTTILGRPVTLSSSVRSLARDSETGEKSGQRAGLTISLLPEQADGNILTVSMELSGADYVDESRTRLEPISHRAVHTVTSGTRFLVSVTVPETPQPSPEPGGKEDALLRPVNYLLFITPTLG